MTEFYRKTVIWSPVILRGSLWISASMLLYMDKILTGLSVSVVKEWGLFDWWYFLVCTAVGTLLAGVLTWRTFLDNTYERHKAQLEKTGQIPTTP